MIRPRLGLTAFLYCFPLLAGAQTKPKPTISGYVEDYNGKRLAGVAVRLTNLGGTDTTDTGEFSIALPSGL